MYNDMKTGMKLHIQGLKFRTCKRGIVKADGFDNLHEHNVDQSNQTFNVRRLRKITYSQA